MDKFKYVIRWISDNMYLQDVDACRWTNNIYEAISFSSIDEAESYLTSPEGVRYWPHSRQCISFDSVNPLNLQKVL